MAILLPISLLVGETRGLIADPQVYTLRFWSIYCAIAIFTPLQLLTSRRSLSLSVFSLSYLFSLFKHTHTFTLYSLHSSPLLLEYA
jgi:hypothetical protein